MLLEIHSLVPQELRVNLFETCKQNITDKAWVFINVSDLLPKLQRLVQLIPEEYEHVKSGAQYVVNCITHFKGTTQCFFINNCAARESAILALIIGKHQKMASLRNLTLDLIANMHIKDHVKKDLAHIAHSLDKQDSYNEIKKAARTLAQGYRDKQCIFSILPQEINWKISGLTGNTQLHSKEQSTEIVKQYFCKP